MLHVTNGDSVLCGFREGGIPGEHLAWADPLHDGPVPTTGSLEELAAIRAHAFAGFGWGVEEEILARFLSAIRVLRDFRRHEEVVLWFEHDLFDELLVTQLLDWFCGEDLGPVALTMVRINSHPAVSPFHGLGQLSGSQLAALLPTRVPVSRKQLEAARAAWAAFRSGRPNGPPRLMEEYPGEVDGLSRLERELLRAAEQGPGDRHTLYQRAMAFEECPWGDSSVFIRLEGLMGGPNPAIAPDGSLTCLGERLLAGKADWVSESGGLDRWIGSVHLLGGR